MSAWPMGVGGPLGVRRSLVREEQPQTESDDGHGCMQAAAEETGTGAGEQRGGGWGWGL